MSPVSVLVVEDENIVRKDIQQSLVKLGYDVAGACGRAEEAIAAAAELSPDIVLMDIMLRGESSGINAAESIRNTHNIPVIFLTAHADEGTLSKAKIAEPYGYILKPFKEIELKGAIEMAIYKHQKFTEIKRERDFLVSFSKESQPSQKNVLFVKSNSRMVRVDYKDIFFVEALKDYVAINTETNRYTIHTTMKEIEKKLNSLDFIRAHRSFIVRADKIVAIENHQLVLQNNKKLIPVGGLYRDSVYEKLNLA